MNYVKNLTIAGFLLLSAGLIHSFQKPTNLGRYSEIIKAFDVDAKKFNPGFTALNEDIATITTRKEFLKKDLESKKITYATSWMPLLYKIFGTGFGLESIRRSILGGYLATDQAIGLSREVRSMVDYPLAALSYMNYPISYPIRKAEGFVKRAVINRDSYTDIYEYIKSSNIFLTASSVGISLATALLMKYLFNRASSYKNEIENIEKEIEIDGAMIDVLSKVEAA